MADQSIQRRLAAILAADVVGYSGLMEADEDGTLSAWHSARSDTIDPNIKEHGGRIVKHTGDGFLAEFPMVSEAVKCAAAIQKGLAGNPLEFRMGINLGEIMDDGEDIHGDGVNIAARLEGIADAGGICVSGSVYDQVRKKTDLVFEDLGEQTVKNISTPVRAYKLLLKEVASKPLPLPDKPSIAVLPFDNLSGDPEQEYFSDGITEDIITALSHVRQFFVIARNTTFTYKRQAVDVQVVANELGVRYVLEGSIRRSGNRIRITAQLIDGESGNHIWAERYDRNLDDIFAVQDEITSMVVGAIEPELNRAEQNRARQKPSNNLDAWDIYQRGVWHIWHNTKEHHMEAKRLFRRAIELDSEFCLAYSFLGLSLWRSVQMKLTDTPEEDLVEALKVAKQAITIDQGNALAHWAMGAVYMQTRNHDLAQEEMERAIEINPSFANAYQFLGWAMVYDNQPEEGIRKVQEAQRLSPNDPVAWGMILIQAQAYVNMKEFAKAEKLARQAKLLADSLPINCTLLASIGHTGKTEDAGALLKEVLTIAPDFTTANISDVFPFKHQADIDIWIEGLRKAGVPGG